jgi:hypothetical protein
MIRRSQKSEYLLSAGDSYIRQRYLKERSTMDLEFQIGSELANMKVTLTEFTTLVTHISGEAKHQAVRQSLKELIDEVRRSYETAVDVFSPLYTVDTEKRFDKRFPDLRANFKNKYLKDKGNVRTHSSIVGNKISDLQKTKSWMKGLPFIKASFERLKILGNNWISNDGKLAASMDNFLTSVNKFLDRIDKNYQANPAETLSYLKRSLRQYESDLLDIKSKLDQLNVIGGKL